MIINKNNILNEMEKKKVKSLIQLAYVNSILVKLGILIRFDLNYLEANTNALMIRIRWLANQEKKKRR